MTMVAEEAAEAEEAAKLAALGEGTTTDGSNTYQP